MTDNSSGGYVASASSTYTNFNPYEAFDNEDPGSTAYWSGSTQIYNTNGTWGGGTAAAYTTNVEGVSKYGEWIQIQLPNKIKYNYSKIKAPSPAARQPRDGYILGSNDTSGAWTILHRFEDVSRSSTADLVTYTPPSEYTQFFQYFRLVIETINDGGLQYVGVNTWDIFGCPEYDPEAYGVDVTVKSVPNVPNTDWLEVYYDAKDLVDGAVSTTSGAITGLGGTTNNGTAYGGVTVSDGAFVFDGSGDYIESGLTINAVGTPQHTFSLWVKPSTGDMDDTNNHYLCVWGNTTAQNSWSGLALKGGKLLHAYHASVKYTSDVLFTTGNWHHIVVVIKSTIETVAIDRDADFYVDGVLYSGSYSTLGSQAGNSAYYLNWGSGTSTRVRLASLLSGGESSSSSIANFRLFNRALTSDEIYQLYAYQKEYFGHSTNNMTLKAGRLGIGTSEPRAALDVRGDAFFNGLISSGMPAIFGAVNNANYVQQSAISQNISVVQFSQGPNMERAAGGITCPIAGMYQVQLYTHCWFSGGAYAVKSTQTLDRYNSAGTIYSKANRGSIHNVTMGSSGGNSDQHQITTWLIQVNAGDYLILNHLTSPSTTRNYSNEWNYISAVCVCANNQSLGGGGGSGGGY
jgi:hypothetical protein